MGILEFISNEHAGIIPRALSQIFKYADHQYDHKYERTHQYDDHQRSNPQHQHHHQEQVVDEPIIVSLSFLQLYRETIQDLLAPALNNNSNNSNNINMNMNSSFTSTTTNNNNGISSIIIDENLLIREDPYRGFYVEGLQEFIVRSYSEAGEEVIVINITVTIIIITFAIIIIIIIITSTIIISIILIIIINIIIIIIMASITIIIIIIASTTIITTTSIIIIMASITIIINRGPYQSRSREQSHCSYSHECNFESQSYCANH